MQFGLISGVGFALFYAILGLPLARLADTRSRVRLISIAVGVFSVFAAFCGFARGFVQLLLCRVMVGVGEPAERGENREHAHRDGDQADPAAGVGQPGQGQSQDGVEQGETDAADQAELHVAELQVLLDGPTEREERRPVDHRNGRDHHRQGQEPDPIGARKLAFSRLLHRHHPPARLADAPC